MLLNKYPIEPISHHVKWYPATFAQVWVEGVKFTVIIGNYFRISTRLNIFVENWNIQVREFIINFHNFSEFIFGSKSMLIHIFGNRWYCGDESLWKLCSEIYQPTMLVKSTVKPLEDKWTPAFFRTLSPWTSRHLMRVVCFWSFFLSHHWNFQQKGSWFMRFVLSDPALFSANPKIIYLA